MFNLTIENKLGQRLELTNKESDYQIVSISGLNPPNATIQSASVAGMDGSRFASAKLGERNVVITIKINGNIEANRLFLYKYFKTKHYCKIYFLNESRHIYVEGYVETIECNLFEIGERMQISIVCNDPYLKAIDEIVYNLSQIIGQFEFPFAFGSGGIEDPTDTDDAVEFSIIEKNRYVNVTNEGDNESGFIIEITAAGTVVEPVIYSIDTNERIGFSLTLVAGDVLTINTNRGEKSAKLLHNGSETSCLRYLQRDSAWLKLQVGDNQFTYDATTGDDFMQVLFKHRNKYEGV